MEGKLCGKSSHCRCFNPAGLITCFFLVSSFLVVAALSFYASPEKFGFLLGHLKKQIGTLSVDHAYDVWPSSEFWRKLSQDTGRKMHNTCTFSGCPSAHPTDESQSQFKYPFDSKQECPLHFRYIHEDLSPWTPPNTPAHDNNDKHNSIPVSKMMLDTSTPLADFRVVIKKGRLYIDAIRPCFQTRSVFTIWGLLQLLRFYPGLVPDVDMLFGCGDTPRVFRRNYPNPSVSPPPPVFRYCSTPLDFDIPFPDWTFWGWTEVDLKPWDGELYGILKGENELLWEERNPTAFWKGNTDTGGALRKELPRCNGPTIIHQNWYQEINAHFKNSRLEHQCKHRYKIYAEGWGWSVSLKYIMACDSPAFVIDPVFHDFYSRALMPLKNFWPVRRDKVCNSINFGTKWGNNNMAVAEAIGRAGRQFVTKELSMKHVYDYMLHVLYKYSKLLDFEPVPGPNMKEICNDAFLCQAPAQEKVFYRESMVEKPSEEPPCFLPPRDEAFIQERLARRHNITQLVHKAEESADGDAYLKAYLQNGHGLIT